jgi:hypothetical protein
MPYKFSVLACCKVVLGASCKHFARSYYLLSVGPIFLGSSSRPIGKHGTHNQQGLSVVNL